MVFEIMKKAGASKASRNDALGPGYVAGISWPRSGHELLARMLGAYFGEDFGYCKGIRQEDCCKSFPCTRSGHINFGKNHDWKFETPQIAEIKYLIQYRKFVPSVVSNFDLHVRNGEDRDTPLEFRKYVSEQWTRHQKFLEKWVNSKFAHTQLVIDYDDLTSEPIGVMKKAIIWFDPAAAPDKEKIKNIVSSVAQLKRDQKVWDAKIGEGVKNTRNVKDFRYYDKELFELLENLALSRPEVVSAYKDIRGCRPEEQEILKLQCFTSKSELQHHLRRDQYFSNWFTILRRIRSKILRRFK